MSIRVKAVKTIRYGGKSYRPGQHFEVSEKHSKVLLAIKKVSVDEKKEEKIKEAPKPAAKAEHAVKTATLKAEGKSSPAKGEYNRSDMVAEGSKK